MQEVRVRYNDWQRKATTEEKTHKQSFHRIVPGFLGEFISVLLDDRQITHLIRVRLKLLLYDFLGGVLGLLPVKFLHKRPKTPPKKVI